MQMKMKTTLNLAITVFLANIMIMPLFAMAQNNSGGGGGNSSSGGLIPAADTSMVGSIGANRFATGNVEAMLNTVANYTVGVLVMVAIFYILWAGYTFVTSSGETDKVNAARQRIMYAAIGIVVALLAKGIVALVLSLTNAA